MLSWRNATMPPAKIITNSTSISTRCRNENSINAFIAGCLLVRRSGAGGRPIDEQAALGDHLLPWLQPPHYLDHPAVDQSWRDRAPLDRLVVMRHPNARAVALIDHRIARNGGPGIALVGEDGDVGIHFRLQRAILVVHGGPDQQPAR